MTQDICNIIFYFLGAWLLGAWVHFPVVVASRLAANITRWNNRFCLCLVWISGEGEGDGSQRVQEGHRERSRSLPHGPGCSRMSASSFVSSSVPNVASPNGVKSISYMQEWHVRDCLFIPQDHRCCSPQDVFTISVGNLPPGATVLIKVTFVSELIVRDGSILFSLPGSVAPWQESAALNQTTQVRKVWTTTWWTCFAVFLWPLLFSLFEFCSLKVPYYSPIQFNIFE